jgi:hypothetical protein
MYSFITVWLGFVSMSVIGLCDGQIVSCQLSGHFATAVVGSQSDHYQVSKKYTIIV